MFRGASNKSLKPTLGSASGGLAQPFGADLHELLVEVPGEDGAPLECRHATLGEDARGTRVGLVTALQVQLRHGVGVEAVVAISP